MKRQFIYICIAVLALTSCKKYLDIKPRGSFIPETVTDFDRLLNNSNVIEYNFQDNNRGSTMSYLTDNIEMSQGQEQAGYVLPSLPTIDQYFAHTFRHPYRNPEGEDFFWGSSSGNGCYPNASYFNNVIEGIRGISGKSASDQQLGDRSIAQAMTARAWSYFHLNLVIGPVYKSGSSNTTRTISYVTSPNLSDPIPMLSTSEEMMTHVLQDIHTALPDLPVIAEWPSRANKAVAHAMLAYYHLFTRKYDSVLYYSNLAWSSTGNDASKVFYDFNLFSFNSPSTPTSSTLISPQDGFVNAVNSRENLLYRGGDLNAGAGNSYPSSEMIGLFDQANDLRFKFFYISGPGFKSSLGGGFDDGTRIGYYRGGKAKNNEGFTFPEVLLMRAEANARLGQLASAIADLNILRPYRYKTGTPLLVLGAMTQDQVIQLVLDERRRELPLGGIKRFLDLKRFVLESGKPWSKSTITHKIGSQTYTGTVDSKDFSMEILNPILRFHPEWGIPLDNRKFQ